MRGFSSILWAAVLVAGLFSAAQAQSSQLPLKGKRVAVYFSSRQFDFDDSYRIPLSQFIKSDEGDKAEIEDIKRQTLIALGRLFSEQLQAPTQADSVYFLNENPELGKTFIDRYDSDERTLESLGPKFAGTDLVLIVNPLNLTSYKTSSVYSRSNRIITDQITVKTARMSLEVFSPSTGQRLTVAETCMDERKTQVAANYFDLHMKSSKTGQFLGKLFTLAVQNLNEGKASNCE